MSITFDKIFGHTIHNKTPLCYKWPRFYVTKVSNEIHWINMINTLLTILVLIVFLIYYVSNRKFNYWKQQKIPYITPVPFLGNYGSYILMKKYLGHVVQSICEKFPDAPYIGAFYGTEPTLVVQDPEMLKTIMTKDFYYFNGREISNYTHNEVMTRNLCFSHGDTWKVLRQNLAPLFSSAKMKNMFHLIEKCSHVFQDMLDAEYKINNVQEVRSLAARYTMDCIGSCVFGVETNTMTNNFKDNPFTVIGNLIFLNSYYKGFKWAARNIWPAIFYGLGMKFFPTKADTLFNNLLLKVFADRQYEPTNRNDFVDLLLNMKKDNYIAGDSIKNTKGGNKKVQLAVNDEMIVGQCVLFFAAGYETSATTLHYTLYELAKNQEAQKQAINEVDEYLKRHNNKLSYECISELPYTEACLDEASRLYPVLGVLTREVYENYRLPCGAVLEKGVRVHVPVYHLHHHPDFFPEPEVFRPERFFGEEKRNIRPYTYMPFGEGPRICIGMRFAKMQMLGGIITVLKKYRVELTDDTPLKLEFAPTTIVTQPTEIIKLKFVERAGWEQRVFV